jgi:cob(I)alamin adenosyltransferase
MPDDPKAFDAPQRVAINRVYTRKGDDGSTRLVGGQKLAKHHPRIQAYGAVDELNAFVGSARQTLAEQGQDEPGLAWLDGVLRRVQHELFNLGSILATLPEDVHPRQPRILEGDATRLEEEMDRCNADLEPLRSFVLPGGSRLATDLHLCRTVCRRAERCCTELAELEPVDPPALAYLNRLGDAFFVFSRWVVVRAGAREELWDPNVTG